jgi:hypothetical protein
LYQILNLSFFVTLVEVAAKERPNTHHKKGQSPSTKQKMLFEEALRHVTIEHCGIGVLANRVAVEAVAVERMLQIARRLRCDEDVLVVDKLDACATRTPLGILVGTPEQRRENAQDKQTPSVSHPGGGWPHRKR